MISIQKRRIVEMCMKDDSFLLLPGATLSQRNGDVMFPFRQNSHVLLLTEVQSPDIVLCCRKQDGISEWRIFSDPLNEHEKLWGTDRLTPTEISHISGISMIENCSSLLEYIKDNLSNNDLCVYTPQSMDNMYLEELRTYNPEFLSLHEILESARMIKISKEIEYIESAIAVTHEAFQIIQKNLKPGMYEYEIEALIAGVFRSHHLTEAYPTIVASGPNACTLHYTKHNRVINDGDMILVDFGAEYLGYAADITRVFSVGTITERQNAVYQSVLRVKEFAQSCVKPGVKKSEYESQVRERMNEELKNLGLMSDESLNEEQEKLSRKYFPHSVSHFLGLDVHDVGGRDTIFEPGMVITCEPGIYIPEESLGIRLEDDLLITANGCENLSRGIPLILQK